ncbi:helix-turn-helix domain-containing protein [Skermania sp. ID1734]|uniref:helix-turn-helix domain-containing protein n=1 Tax=Skermania sp. ID1734 TaxID=2597516 RepID=UPI00117DCBC3|nr:helix-turn-helix domain-containing protein [Skermania sp. ID1734]TSD99824.1 helix-turn-helix domain-containing protein [Skermania sp. ID1734]
MNPTADISTDVQRARECFFGGGSVDTGLLRGSILDSWRRSRESDVDPERVDLPFVREPNTDSPFLRAAAPVLRRLSDDLAAQSIAVVLTSVDGVVLDRLTADRALMNAMDGMRLEPGAGCGEDLVGTNAVGTTLRTERPTFLGEGEHYLHSLGALACAGAPIRHPLTRRVIGVIDLTCWADRSSPLLSVLANGASSHIEDRMCALASETEAALLEIYRRECRRNALGVMAVGGDVVVMNQYLRRKLDVPDRLALTEHANDLCRTGAVDTLVASLPSGLSTKVVAVERVISRGCLHGIVAHVQPQAVATLDPAPQAHARDRVLEFLRRNLADPGLDADRVAEACAVSRRTLYRILGKEGVTSQLRRMRIERAMQMLLDEPQLPVGRVGAACGFDSESGFHRAFRATTGQTPGEYRQLGTPGK